MSVQHHREGGTHEQVLTLLREVGIPLGLGVIAETLGYPKPTVAWTLRELKWEGLVTNPSRGYWAIKEGG
jgi:DNA-binding IclR family transcriptional regulator